MEDTQQSQMIEQRNVDGPAIDFEAQSSSMMNPSI